MSIHPDYVLALDASMAACSAAIFDAGRDRVLASAFEAMATGQAEAIAPMVERCLKDAALRPENITRIAVTTGPGTFTGLRIGVSFAHGMVAALGCAVVGLDTLTATAAPLLPKPRLITVVHQAGATGKFYVAQFTGGTQAVAPFFASLADILAMPGGGEDKSLLIGTGADAVLAAAPDRFHRQVGNDLPDAAAFAPFASGLPEAAELPQPLYLREPDAKPAAAATQEPLRLATLADIPSLSRLHRICFKDGWDEASLAASLATPGAGAIVAGHGNDARAFLLYRDAGGEAEILTLCTEPRWRRRHLAERLVATLKELLRTQNVVRLHLEVANDNAAALGLYHKLGFVVSGRRTGYYARSTGAVDAVLMALTP